MKITLGNIGDVYRAKQSTVDTMELKGYELVKEFFVDSSGFGLETEPALTASTFEQQLKMLIEEHGPLTAKITNAGMFQVYVGMFKKVGNKRCKRIANNTLLITNDDGTRRIRLHDTDILTETGKGTIMLDNGGWDTLTTRERMNRYLDGARVERDRGRTFVVCEEVQKTDGTGFIKPKNGKELFEGKRMIIKAKLNV